MNPRRIPRYLRALAGEALIVISAYLAYSVVRVLIEGDETLALENALRLVSVEQTLGVFREADVQRAVDAQSWLAASMRWIYLWAYLPLVAVAGLLIYLRDQQLYRLYRNTMFVSAAIGLVIFALMPVAPPRMLPEYGFADSLHSAFAATSVQKNDFAAIPSFHCGFWLLAGLGVAHAYNWRPWLIGMTVLAPAIMVLAIVSTANHFFIDALVGSLVVMSVWSIVVARHFEREPRRATNVLQGERQRL